MRSGFSALKRMNDQSKNLCWSYFYKALGPYNMAKVKIMNKKAVVYFQSGGPTAVINSSLCGWLEEALKHDEIGEIEIPAEALEAEEVESAEDLVPDFSNMF